MSVITRFAPSPTGYLHIGGARTALFSWLYARRHGGQFLLRIEDTDRERSTDAAVSAIIDGLRWLGLDWDGDPIFQFARAARHRAAVEDLINRGRAFRCYATTDEIDTARAEAKAEGRALRSPFREGRPAPAADAPYVVRFKAPDTGAIDVSDEVRGTVRTKASDLDDMVLLRGDGTPTYMLAVVVDDYDMGITHVIRGEDHLTNAGRQQALIEAFGWTPPVYAHIPLINGPDGTKLSKRHGATAIGDYADKGYLPEAMRNYLLRLGWSHGDDEIIADAQARDWFDLEHIGRSPSQLDFDKLNSVNAHYLKLADDERLSGLLLSELARRGDSPSGVMLDRLVRGVPHIKARAKTIVELGDQSKFLLTERPLSIAPADVAKLNDEAKARLQRLSVALSALDGWTAAALEHRLKDFATEEGVGFGKIGPILRIALTGGMPAPDLGTVMALFGRDEVLHRLADVSAQNAN